MKKLLILLAFVPMASFGQFSKGTKYVGGNMTYFSTKTNFSASNNPANTLFSLNGQTGFFINESWAVGPVVNFVSSNRPNINPVTNLFEDLKVSGFAGGLFARKFFSISEKFFFSLEGKGLVGTINRDLNSSLYEESSTRVYLSLRPAFTFMPNQKWGFDASIGEVFYQSNWNTGYLEENNFQINLGQVNLGVNYFFGRK
ncbi:outer membrane beta-barrel protein [Belliella sp. DSM 107340]|uniref:Outer membrane beta-barrel protein n=1 Tax=Belliella calami TaxID=2923436 RepID=A0ABS9UTZ7_9BACT|nr:outer membrane beta-barrel protein [Belliella calami]MCH7399894.1 outer membrane beta-barrel protein [Belliella calami]